MEEILDWFFVPHPPIYHLQIKDQRFDQKLFLDTLHRLIERIFEQWQSIEGEEEQEMIKWYTCIIRQPEDIYEPSWINKKIIPAKRFLETVVNDHYIRELVMRELGDLATAIIPEIIHAHRSIHIPANVIKSMKSQIRLSALLKLVVFMVEKCDNPSWDKAPQAAQLCQTMFNQFPILSNRVCRIVTKLYCALLSLEEFFGPTSVQHPAFEHCKRDVVVLARLNSHTIDLTQIHDVLAHQVIAIFPKYLDIYIKYRELLDAEKRKKSNGDDFKTKQEILEKKLRSLDYLFEYIMSFVVTDEDYDDDDDDMDQPTERNEDMARLLARIQLCLLHKIDVHFPDLMIPIEEAFYMELVQDMKYTKPAVVMLILRDFPKRVTPCLLSLIQDDRVDISVRKKAVKIVCKSTYRSSDCRAAVKYILGLLNGSSTPEEFAVAVELASQMPIDAKEARESMIVERLIPILDDGIDTELPLELVESTLTALFLCLPDAISDPNTIERIRALCKRVSKTPIEGRNPVKTLKELTAWKILKDPTVSLEELPLELKEYVPQLMERQKRYRKIVMNAICPLLGTKPSNKLLKRELWNVFVTEKASEPYPYHFYRERLLSKNEHHQISALQELCIPANYSSQRLVAIVEMASKLNCTNLNVYSNLFRFMTSMNNDKLLRKTVPGLIELVYIPLVHALARLFEERNSIRRTVPFSFQRLFQPLSLRATFSDSPLYEFELQFWKILTDLIKSYLTVIDTAALLALVKQLFDNGGLVEKTFQLFKDNGTMLTPLTNALKEYLNFVSQRELNTQPDTIVREYMYEILECWNAFNYQDSVKIRNLLQIVSRGIQMENCRNKS